MKTDDLIRTLTADGAAPRLSLESLLAVAVLLGFIAATIGFMMTLHPRPDLPVVAHTLNFQLKFAVTLTLAVTAAGFYWRALRPGAAAGAWSLALAAAPIVLAAGVAHELTTQAASAWMPAMIGDNHWVCLASIPLLSSPVLAGLLYVSRHGAPESPPLAGALAGLIAGGLGATLYATHCTDDSPLFVLVWYGVSILSMAGIGALVGARVLRW